MRASKLHFFAAFLRQGPRQVFGCLSLSGPHALMQHRSVLRFCLGLMQHESCLNAAVSASKSIANSTAGTKAIAA